ncbi:MAG TPA: 30S ribosomal protein S27ae [Thermoplasmata archaeon]|nr:30S ribosomal protein S27ae [Thermoplasmata archaeon]
MAKARVGLYSVQGEQLSRTHKACPKCGPGVFLAEHGNRRSCGKCGYSESKSAPTPAPKAKAGKPGGEPKPAA